MRGRGSGGFCCRSCLGRWCRGGGGRTGCRGRWAWFMQSGSFAVIWAVFGIANQMLAVIALAIVSVYLVNEGRGKYLWATAVPMCFVFTTTSSAAALMLKGYI